MKRLQTTAKTSMEKSAKPSSSKQNAKHSDKKAPSAPFLSLESSMKDPTVQVFKNERYVCIKDKYPKAKVHLLLIPFANVISNEATKNLLKVQDLIKLPNAVDILKEMKSLTENIIQEKFPDKVNKSNVLYGFHAVQSMQPLHMHIISNDFQSDCLKNKKHWNSFTTKYFVKLNDLLDHLENVLKNDYFVTDKFNLNKPQVLKNYLDSDLKCHICNAAQNNMPNLKRHLLTHSK